MPGGEIIIQQAANLDPNRLVLFKQEKKLAQNNTTTYVVEISTNAQTGNLYIAAFDMNSPESLLIDLPAQKATEILA